MKRKFACIIAIEVESENYVDVVLQSGAAVKSANNCFAVTGQSTKIMAVNVNPLDPKGEKNEPADNVQPQ